jgi:hypothetical protein
MTGNPEDPTANGSETWEEVGQQGMPEQMGCPDIRPLGPTLVQLLKVQNVPPAILAGFLAIIVSEYKSFGGRVRKEYQGACNVPVPVEVIALIGELLVGKTRWSREHNAAQTEAARRRTAEWQKKADAIWLKNPKLSPTAVAKRIAPDNWNYVRQLIKPAK